MLRGELKIIRTGDEKWQRGRYILLARVDKSDDP